MEKVLADVLQECHEKKKTGALYISVIAASEKTWCVSISRTARYTISPMARLRTGNASTSSTATISAE